MLLEKLKSSPISEAALLGPCWNYQNFTALNVNVIGTIRKNLGFHSTKLGWFAYFIWVHPLKTWFRPRVMRLTSQKRDQIGIFTNSKNIHEHHGRVGLDTIHEMIIAEKRSIQTNIIEFCLIESCLIFLFISLHIYNIVQQYVSLPFSVLILCLGPSLVTPPGAALCLALHNKSRCRTACCAGTRCCASCGHSVVQLGELRFQLWHKLWFLRLVHHKIINFFSHVWMASPFRKPAGNFTNKG